MKNITDSFVSVGHWPSVGSFEFNTDILATNPINLSVVLGVLIFFGKGVVEADEYRTNGYSEIEREKVNLINATCDSLKRLENLKNETLFFEQQRAINQVQQQVFQQALQRALGTLNNCLNSELHFRTISANIGILGSVEEITD
uniref:ATP synthase CF0 subunit I n=1 Tax=Danhatchia australis TaxID=2917549 RepID=UPI0023D83205|nr:ATP synthase CF0 subunit I [Danhatchia australis]UKU08997.1 ATP synthase CF0 subunit I [Danhatchia australis]